MLAPIHPYRMAPPARPSCSLEGLERVIPPTLPSLSPTPKQLLSSTRSLFLNKPLPDTPPTEEYCTAWSDTSDSENESEGESTLDSVAGPSEPRNSTELYPIFVSSGSDDFSDLVEEDGGDDHPADPAVPVHHDHHPLSLGLGPSRPSPQRFLSKESRTDSNDSCGESVLSTSAPLSVTVSEAQYGRPALWSQTRSGTNHYFREKKWDFFPELATPSALQASGKVNPGVRSGKTKRKDGRLNLAAKRRRWQSLDRAGQGLAHGVRDSIKTYVHRTLSRESTENKSTRPATAPIDLPYDQRVFQQSESTTTFQSSATLDAQLRAMSLSTVSMNDMPESPRSIRTQRSAPAPRQKQLAVPLSPYQRYGSAIWESPKKSKTRPLRMPRRSRKPADVDTSSTAFTFANPTPPLSPPFKMQLQQNTHSAVRVLQGGTSHVLVALDGAKKKIAESKDTRRRQALKSRIQLVGPIDPHDCLPDDPWI